MAATEHGSAGGHEVGDGVGAIADELLQIVGDEGLAHVFVCLSCGV